LGTQLLRYLLKEVRQKGAQTVFLEVRESNRAAFALYRKCGFQQSGRRKAYYRQPTEDAILYQLDFP
jgi:[ribosomal protein S18]-alanine N-acetyltransferase